MAVSEFNPVRAFTHAEHFRSATGALGAAELGGSLTAPVAKDRPPVPYSELVMGFMGTEFYLKSILRSLELKVGDHHDLWRLYSAVRPAEHKEVIRLYYSDVLDQRQATRDLAVPRSSLPDFDAQLKTVGDLFNVLRYIYEDGRELPTGQILSVGLTMEAVRRYALELLIRDGKLYYLMAEAKAGEDGEVVDVEDGEKLPINRDTPNLRQVLRERFFSRQLVGDTFSVGELDLVVIEPD